MRIESVRNASTLERGESPTVETLESRLLAASQEQAGGRRPDLEFERLYQSLLAMEGRGEKAIYDYLRSLRRPDGEAAAYPTAKALMAISLQVLVRLKDEKLENSPLYKEISGANGLAFSMDLFVKGFMRDVFKPMEDDAWQKSEW